MLLNIGRKRVQIANISTAYRNLGHRMQVRNDIYLVEQRNNYAKTTGWPDKNVPNFRMALCNRVGEMDQYKSMYVMSKHLRICL